MSAEWATAILSAVAMMAQLVSLLVVVWVKLQIAEKFSEVGERMARLETQVGIYAAANPPSRKLRTL